MDEVENVRGLEAIKEKMEMPKPQPIEKRERERERGGIGSLLGQRR